MMNVSKKCQYALRALFELAWRNNGQPIKTSSIARAQGMSLRFTEIILNELKHGGFVESRRGSEGGYLLAQDAPDVTVGQVIEYLQGPISFVPDAKRASDNVLLGAEAFKQLWQDVNGAVSAVLDGTTFANLVELERARREQAVPNYCI